MQKLTLLLSILLFSISLTYSQTNVLVIDYNNNFSSDQNNNNSRIYSRLLTTQTSVTRVASIPATINATQYEQVWIFGNMGFPNSTTLNPIINYMNNGGAVYIQSEVSCCNNPAAFADQLIDSTVIVGGSITHQTMKSGNYEYELYSALKCTPFLSHGAAVRPFIGATLKHTLYEATPTCGSAITTGDVVGVKFSSCDMISGEGALIVNGDFNIFPMSGTCGSVGILGTPNNNDVIDLIADMLPALACSPLNNPGGTLTCTANPINFCGSTQLGWTYTGSPGCSIIGCNQDTTYKWSVVSGEPINVPINFSCDTCPYPIASPSVTTTYTLSITIGDTNLNCSSYNVIPVTVNPLPLPSKGNITYTSSCNGNVDLTITGAYDSIQWQSSINGNPYSDIIGADSTQLSQQNVTSGICYRVKISTQCGSIYSDTICPTIINGPTAAFSVNPSSQSIVGAPVSFTDNSIGNIIAWQWAFGDGDSSSIQHPTHIYQTHGNYNVSLIVTDTSGCMDSTNTDHEVISNLIIPNVFTPNGDGHNDLLVFKNLEFFNNYLQIFNRWGNLIYEKENYKNNWDGEGTADGTYLYILEVYNENNELKTYKGTLNILK